ncbi:hypothetical protein CATYP_03635 [Corynebacterium atypicum]|uniref:Secreted protein n=1 Tax=Corynebacterium atypicum TaxID=191610 RepID=A0ABN4DF41_9CORY|nr:hypothetical protein [Corynebacterium atypicum]AIG63899.1 hypothetical protein CATYP_03635 [Corynebacterium atypicum]
MNHTLPRPLALAAAVVAGAALTACTPPHENDSALKVDTATEAPAEQGTSQTAQSPAASAAGAHAQPADGELPGYANCAAAPTVRPASITLDCVQMTGFVTGIQWQEWTTQSATGTGQRGAKTVTVELSEPASAEGGQGGTTFTAIAIDGEPQHP